jgi:iron-sulfur cluster assembly protein/iron-sulfur cluster insertion protein
MSAEVASIPTAPAVSDSVITLTEAAARQITSMLAEDRENAGKTLRVFVEAGGCSGMQYGMVFDERRDDDLVSEFYGVGVLIDPFSSNYLQGSLIDFSDALTGGGFKIKNPKASSSCGCGKSFEA